MIACYDLSCNPPTYDVVAFLARLEIERLRRGEEFIDLYIKPGPAGGFRRDGLWPRSVEERVKLRDKVLVPLCHLLPSVRTVTVGAARAPEARGAVGVGERWISLPAILEALKAGCRPLRSSRTFGVKPKLITFTLREAAHHPERNSNVEEWVTAARILNDRGFSVIVIRDTLKAREPIHGISIEPWASEEIQRRAALYRQATVNVGISNGPLWMAIFMDVHVLMLRPVTDGYSGYDSAYYKKCGVPKGSQLPTSPLYQRFAWVDDTCENIVREVNEMLRLTGLVGGTVA